MKRAKRSAWEVEVLIDADEDSRVVSSLFSRMVAGVGKTGAERIFVRLDESGRLARTARDAGFFPYQQQTLYRLRERIPVEDPQLPLRARAKEDLHGIFQMYNRTMPANVRGIEGATFANGRPRSSFHGADGHTILCSRRTGQSPAGCACCRDQWHGSPR